MASVTRYRNGWRVFIRRDGVKRSRTFSTKAEAERWARQAEGKIAAPDFVDTSEAEKTSLADILTRYAEEVIPTKKGAAQERRKINVLLKDPLAAMPLTAITSSKVASWRSEQVAAGKAPSTIGNALNVISQAYEVARVKWGIPCTNPTRGVRRVGQRPGRDCRLAEDEEQRLLAALDQVCPWTKAAFILALETAMRQGELLAARREDLRGRVLSLRDTKNGSVRHVPLSGRALETIREVPANLDGRIIPLLAPMLDWRWRQACRIAGVEGLRWHDLRHEAVSRLFERGLSVPEVMKISGHKTYAMLMKYLHLETEQLAEKLG